MNYKNAECGEKMENANDQAKLDFLCGNIYQVSKLEIVILNIAIVMLITIIYI